MKQKLVSSNKYKLQEKNEVNVLVFNAKTYAYYFLQLPSTAPTDLSFDKKNSLKNLNPMYLFEEQKTYFINRMSM